MCVSTHLRAARLACSCGPDGCGMWSWSDARATWGLQCSVQANNSAAAQHTAHCPCHAPTLNRFGSASLTAARYPLCQLAHQGVLQRADTAAAVVLLCMCARLLLLLSVLLHRCIEGHLTRAPVISLIHKITYGNRGRLQCPRVTAGSSTTCVCCQQGEPICGGTFYSWVAPALSCCPQQLCAPHLQPLQEPAMPVQQ